MNQRNTLLFGGVFGCTAVMLGAFGAHALKETLSATGRIDTYELAVKYQFYHALALLLAGVLMGQFGSKFLRHAALSFSLGILFFSGSLYILSFTGQKILGAVTPFGGVFFIIGWILLILGLYKK
jgi:uncharacterized membrane protein YgdD (TMEM256/DUF423 family)